MEGLAAKAQRQRRVRHSIFSFAQRQEDGGNKIVQPQMKMLERG